MVTLFIMRHGVAESGEGKADADRALTAEGVAAVRKVARGLQRRGLRFDAVLASPLLRTQQTARTLCDELRCSAPVVCAEMAPGATCETVLPPVLGALRGRADASILVIGHMPDVAQMLRRLGPGASLPPSFAPATLACIEFHGTPCDGGGRTLWVATAEEMAAW